MHPIVHWSEGLFLRTQHFQTAERRLREEIAVAQDWGHGYQYGLAHIELDDEALLNWELRVLKLHARFRDGTALRFPEEADLDPLKLPETLFDGASAVRVSVAVPRLQLPGTNAAADRGGDARYVVTQQWVEDENEKGKSQQIATRQFNARLTLQDELPGYETLPILQLRRSHGVGSNPEIDPDYIAPLLCCDAWPPLVDRILHPIFGRISGYLMRLNEQAGQQRVTLESGRVEDQKLLMQIQAWNTALGKVWNLPFTRGVHPLEAYCRLCEIVGLIAIFRPDLKFPELPRYDHDELGYCFRTVDEHIEIPEGPKAIKRPFIVSGLQLEANIEDEWLGADWELLVGVETGLPFKDVDALLAEELKLKIGSTYDVDHIFNHGEPGVDAIPVLHPPREAPARGWWYWRFDRDCTPWKNIEKTMAVGIRIDENHTGPLRNGQETVEVKLPGPEGRRTNMTFALWAVPKSV